MNHCWTTKYMLFEKKNIIRLFYKCQRSVYYDDARIRRSAFLENAIVARFFHGENPLSCVRVVYLGRSTAPVWGVIHKQHRYSTDKRPNTQHSSAMPRYEGLSINYIINWKTTQHSALPSNAQLCPALNDQHSALLNNTIENSAKSSQWHSNAQRFLNIYLIKESTY